MKTATIINDISKPIIYKTPQKTPKITLRGLNAMLPHGGLPEFVSPHLIDLIEKTGGASGPIGLQFIAQPEKELDFSKKNLDPLIEDHHEVAPGLVYKYRGKIKNKKIQNHGRALWTITRFCASYCRFCTRGREVGMMPTIKSCTNGAIANKTILSDADLEKVFNYIKKRPELNEIILSGGDPLTTPREYFQKIILGLAKLQKEGHLDIIRIGTRLPIHNPITIKEWHYTLLSKIKNPNLMIHINHPAELTEQTVKVLNNFKKFSLANVFSQTVLLKGVNDCDKILYDLFTNLTKEGIRPYYVFQNDPVYWAKHFTVPIKKAIKIWERMRCKLSGIAATARFVIDTPFGYGKITIPEGKAWKVDYEKYFDFKNKEHQLL